MAYCLRGVQHIENLFVSCRAQKHFPVAAEQGRFSGDVCERVRAGLAGVKGIGVLITASLLEQGFRSMDAIH